MTINLCATPKPLLQVLKLVLNEQHTIFLEKMQTTRVIVTFFLFLRERTVCDKQATFNMSEK